MNQYYYLNEQGQQVGPIDLASLKFAGLKPGTMVWCSGMPSWMAAKDVPEINSVIANAQPNTPPPPPSQQQNDGPTDQQTNDSQTRINTNPTQQTPQGLVKPQNWLWLGICTTIACCLPVGIVSIIYAGKVDSAWEQGDYQDAVDYANKARMWGLISAGLGIVGSIFIFIIALITA